MERVYALGITCIEFTQYWFKGRENYFEVINHLANPHYAFEYVFPMVSVIDSVFAAQFLLCISFGSWLNAVLKWWFLEERPYWWVQETSFFGHDRPRLRQFQHTCETGPGSPSGHSTFMAMQLMLVLMWIAHVMNDRKCYIWWWKYIMYPVCAVLLVSTILARMFIGAHFPHQCIIGATIGLFLAPGLCIYVSDPFIWPYNRTSGNGMCCRIFMAVGAMVISFMTYWCLKLFGIDPQWSIRLAFRWCEQPENIHVATTPIFALIQSTGCLLGWAISHGPELAKYRHYTRNRSLILAIMSAVVFMYMKNYIQENICKNSTWYYYSVIFILYVAKAVVCLKFVPYLASCPYIDSKPKAE